MLPAAAAYAALLEALGPDVEAVAKDLGHEGPEPPEDYVLEVEIAGVLHRIEPERLASSLRKLWRRAERPPEPSLNQPLA